MSALLDLYLPFMRDVARCEKALHELGVMWRVVESITKTTCRQEAAALLPTLAATRTGFRQLEQELVSSLVQEKLRQVQHDLSLRAHFVIDIVVRNLYERTADIGFLATDRELCDFASGRGTRAECEARLRAYRAKYTVYDDVVILDLDGQVLARADGHGAALPDPALVAAALQAEGYLEQFGPSPLKPQQGAALLYVQPLRSASTGVPVGVLCLSFQFTQEMRGIFRAYLPRERPCLLVLADAEGKVLASADPSWVAVGTQLPEASEDGRPIQFGGRHFLMASHAAAGYQGYAGPAGWRGVALQPLDAAFLSAGEAAAPDPGLLAHAKGFCPPLAQVLDAADTIRRVVWNGQVMAASHGGDQLRLRSVLEQINETGAHSQAVFSRSIDELLATSVQTMETEAGLTARLLVDLVDRNLYERADDCRWWALTPELRLLLAAPSIDAYGLAQLQSRLEHLNRLYTVYTHIFVYDADGCILASSDVDKTGIDLAGMHVEDASLQAVSRLPNEQAYYVTPFAPSAFYGGRPTYVYHAAIRAPQGNTVVGGIGLVFHTEREFRHMLQGALGEDSPHVAHLLDGEGRVVASTDPACAPGELLPACAGQYVVTGKAQSPGYREFKRSDGYRDDLVAVVERRLGAIGSADSLALPPQQPGGIDYASFSSHGACYALPADVVCEALPGNAMNSLSMGGRPERVGVIPWESEGERQFLWVLDFGLLTEHGAHADPARGQILIVRHNGRHFGLLVDDLLAVGQYGEAALVPLPLAGMGPSSVVASLLRTGDEAALVQVIAPNMLWRRVVLDEVRRAA